MKKSDPSIIIAKLKNYKKKISQTDYNVRLYVSDKKKYPHPNHEDLISEIKRFENQIYMVRDTEVQLRLDSLMHSLLIHQQIWTRLFEQGLPGAKREDEQPEKEDKEDKKKTHQEAIR